jgi:Alpha-2,8-polysialyltransferase (POLYST)
VSAAGAQRPRHLFLVRSSLQFLLASALAEHARSGGDGASRMIFLPDVLDPGMFERAVAAWPQSPFDRVLTLLPRHRPGTRAAPRSSRAVRDDLVRALAEARPASVTVFNDREEAGQTLLVEAARHFPQALRRCAEDGALAYTGFTYRAHGRLTALRQRLRLGRHWADVRVLGTHPLVQTYAAMYPELLRPELRNQRVQPFPTVALGSPALRQLAERLCEQAGVAPGSLPPGAALLTVSHSSYARRNPGYPAQVRACAARLREQGLALFVKYHPRETEADPLALCVPGLAREVARTLPVECLYLLLREQPLRVVGGMSTSLLTAALLMPQAQVRVLEHASAGNDSWDPALLRALHIEPAR